MGDELRGDRGPGVSRLHQALRTLSHRPQALSIVGKAKYGIGNGAGIVGHDDSAAIFFGLWKIAR